MKREEREKQVDKWRGSELSVSRKLVPFGDIFRSLYVHCKLIISVRLIRSRLLHT